MMNLYDLRNHSAKSLMAQNCTQISHSTRYDDGATMAIYAVKTTEKVHFVCVIKEPNEANPIRVLRKTVSLNKVVTVALMVLKLEEMFDNHKI